VESIVQDTVYALRTLRRRPAFAVMAVATLALGLGSATAIFTVIDGVLLRPLPFRDAGQLVTVWQTDTRFRDQATLRRRWDRLWFTFPEYQQWRAQQRSFSDVAVYGDQQMALTGLGAPAEVPVATATSSLLPLLGVRVALGRWFLPGEEGPGAERLAVISHQVWASRFGSDPGALDRYVTLDENRYRIVGVLPAGFKLRSLTSDVADAVAVWIPLGSDGGGQRFDSSYEAIARLRPGVPLDVASAEADRIVRDASARAERGARVVPRQEAETATARAPLLLLSAGVLLLLLIACANVTTLMLGEASAREHELATRKALGASRSRIIRQLLTESAVLTTCGGACGVALAWAGTRVLVALAPQSMARLDEVTLDARVLAFSAALTACVAIAFGLAPSFMTSRRQVSDTLRAGARQVSGRTRVLDVITSMQVAMALVLLAAASVLGRSLQTLWSVQPGFASDRVLTMSVTVPQTRYTDQASVSAYLAQVSERLAAIPGVRRVGATSNLPLSGRNTTTNVALDGITYASPTDRPNVQRRVVTPGYFEAIGIPRRAGRAASGTGPETEVVIDEAMARRSWPNESALGKRVRMFDVWWTVVGVVGDVRHVRLDDSPQPTVYLPHSKIATREMTLVLATAGDAISLTDAARHAVWSVDASIPVAELETMSARVARSLSAERYRTTLLAAFGLSAALLTAVGIFGVIARAVSQRRRELAIRLALGATLRSIACTILSAQGRSVALGLVVGIGAVWLLSPVLRRFVYGVGPSDPGAIAAAVVFLLLLAAIGAFGPVRRAIRTDPGLALRDAR
jgi:predicted permease